MRDSFNRGENPTERLDDSSPCLPVAKDILAAAGIEPHFIIGGDEPPEIALNADAINALADAAKQTLLEEKAEQ